MIKGPKSLLKLLDEFELDIFTEESFAEETNQSLVEWMPQLRTLIRSGLINIIEKGKYCRHNFRNEYVIGNILAGDGAIAYWTALNLHGLTEQFPNTIFVQTNKQKRSQTVFGVPYQFIKVKKSKITGIERRGFGNHSYSITNREKTIVDCFDLPQYAGEFPGIVRAFVSNNWAEDKLIGYARAVDNKAATKRMGYLSQLFGLPYPQFIEFSKSNVTRAVALFDNNSPDEGRYITQWGLRLNVDEEAILSMKNY